MNAYLSHLIELNRPIKRALQILADSLLIVLCFGAAMALRLESLHFARDALVWLTLLPVIPLTILIFARLGLYRSVIRYISGEALRAVLIGVLASAVILFLSSRALAAPVPQSVPGISALLLFSLAGGVRFLMRSLFLKLPAPNRLPVLVYGAGEAGRQLVNALNHGRDYLPVGFLDDDPALQHTLISGKRVFEPGQIPQIAKQMRLRAILLAIPSATRARRRHIVAQLEPLGIEVKTIPGMADIVAGHASFSDLRQVTPEDLLGRDPVPPRDDLMGRNIAGKVVLVSGAGGSIGSELCRQIIRHDPAALVLLEVSEFALYSASQQLHEILVNEGRGTTIIPVLGSVQDRARVRTVLQEYKVQTIYHAAAYKHVVLVEENVVAGVRNNVFGTEVMAQAAVDLGVESFILVSTDKAVRPCNFMGASKRMAELVCQALARDQTRTTFSLVRFGNVLGSSGSVIPRFRAQIERGGPVTVTHPDVTRYFMTITEAAQLVIQAGAMAKGGDVFVLDMDEPVRILDLAQSMIRLHGLEPYILKDASHPDPARGDVPIQFVGLNKGEKLYEELLIGNNPESTDHPRIMTATELALTRQQLQTYLDRLLRACQAYDASAIRQIFMQAPLVFRPNSDAMHDLMRNATHTAPAASERHEKKLATCRG